MPLPPGPALSAVVPPPTMDAPPGFIRERSVLDNGLPSTVRLPDGIDLILLIPTGTAALWRDADPTTVVSSSAAQVAADPGSQGSGLAVAAVPRLLTRVGGRTVASVPLVAGLRRAVPDDGTAGARVELLLLGWQLTAGSMQKSGSFGSWLDLAWRRADVPHPEDRP
jgi:hypothetical protein